MPEWRSDGGDRVRVLVGSFEDISSPLVPAEPFNFLDVELRRDIAFDLKTAHNALVYVRTGVIVIRTDNREQKLLGEQALALYGGAGRVTLEASLTAHVVILSGAEVREPSLAHGPFIMNERSQIEDAYARYRTGKMGRLAPVSAS